MTEPALPRAERRRRTERRILDAARDLFAERGFERTTIRAVAAAAEVDPALVMQYFGNKRRLFAEAVRVAGPPDSAAGPEEAVEQLLGTLGVKMRLPPASLAMLRSMLTHPEAAATAREALSRQVGQVGAALSGENAPLRAALMTMILLGVTVGHQLLELDELREAPHDDLVAALRPALRALAEPAL
ncbi:TetR/AcrR family transcriptional regulator [Nonomuraea roseoviolacea subsp. roseoviolacea]|uniref:TetR/AcrR family transcriptional regulator n=1 Tax=Nonomuraea roseoviolacea TaxID=103837 RepID=UPI0031CDCDDB